MSKRVIGFDERLGHEYYQTSTNPVKQELLNRGYEVETCSVHDKKNLHSFDAVITNYMSSNEEQYRKMAPIIIYIPHGIGLWKTGTQVNIPTHFLLPSELMKYQFSLERNDKKYYVVGYPRVDSLLAKLKKRDNIRKQFISDMQLDANKPIIAFLPTFTGCNSDKRGTFQHVMREGSKDIPNFIISVHGFDLTRPDYWAIQNKKHLIYAKANKEDLLVSADIIVGDISGIIIESLVCNRPIIHVHKGTAASFELFNTGGKNGLITFGDICSPRDLAVTIDRNLKQDVNLLLREYWRGKALYVPEEGSVKLSCDTIEQILKEQYND